MMPRGFTRSRRKPGSFESNMRLYRAVFLLAMCVLTACGAPAIPTAQPSAPVLTAGDLSIGDAWARPTVNAAASEHSAHGNHGTSSAGLNSAVYLWIENKGTSPERFVAARGDVANAIEIHESSMVDGIMQMKMLPTGAEIPAGTRVDFKPGGLHIMLIDVKQDLVPGGSFKLTLVFQSGREAVVDVVVRQP
jgi:periplasmic copper chaperone A